MRTHFKPTETCQYTYFSSVTRKKLKKTSLKGRPSDFSVKNSSKIIFEEKITNFKAHLLQRGYPEDLINTTISEVNFKDRKLRILPFVIQYQPSVPNLKQILMRDWHLIEKQQLLKLHYKKLQKKLLNYKKPPLVCYKRGRLAQRHTRESQTMKRLF